MEFSMVLEKLSGKETSLNSAEEVEKAIKELSEKEIGTSIVIEVEPAFDTIVALTVDYVERREKKFLKKSSVVDTYYRIHAVLDVSEDEDFINLYYKTNSRLKVNQMLLDFIAARKSPNVKGWTKDNRQF